MPSKPEKLSCEALNHYIESSYGFEEHLNMTLEIVISDILFEIPYFVLKITYNVEVLQI